MKDAGGWRSVQATVPGVAHRASGNECQDACAVQCLSLADGEPVLALAAADGAGSAARSREGAEQACQTLLAECAAWLAHAEAADWTPTAAEFWVQRVQAALQQQADDAGLPVREFACTLLGAVIAANRALFLQIGDGAIVIHSGDCYRPVFWPQGGEYPNETFFVTDASAAERLECATLAEPIREIALLTDGLQPLALHYQTRQAHEPFFRPLFQCLRDYPDSGNLKELATALAQFLDSPAINQRTHDDKTLILACRKVGDAAPCPEEDAAAGDAAAPPADDSGDEAV